LSTQFSGQGEEGWPVHAKGTIGPEKF